jgi:ribonuclease D
MTDFLHTYDLPEDVTFTGDIAVDCEAMGLNQKRDRLCVVQLSDGCGDTHVVHFPTARYDAVHLKTVLADNSRMKLFHFARFDVALLKEYLGVFLTSVYCTRTASRLCRTYTDRHGLKDVCKELLGVDLSKQQQSSYWGAETLTPEQVSYAASDVYYLHRIRDIFNTRLEKEGRLPLALACMDAIPARAWLDLEGWAEEDIFSHAIA